MPAQTAPASGLLACQNRIALGDSGIGLFPEPGIGGVHAGKNLQRQAAAVGAQERFDAGLTENVRPGVQTVAPVADGVDPVAGCAQGVGGLPHGGAGKGQDFGDLLAGYEFPLAGLQQGKQLVFGFHGTPPVA